MINGFNNSETLEHNLHELVSSSTHLLYKQKEQLLNVGNLGAENESFYRAVGKNNQRVKKMHESQREEFAPFAQGIHNSMKQELPK